VKKLCPELLPKLNGLKSLPKQKALSVGGWKDLESMSKDLSHREIQKARAARAAKKA